MPPSFKRRGNIPRSRAAVNADTTREGTERGPSRIGDGNLLSRWRSGVRVARIRKSLVPTLTLADILAVLILVVLGLRMGRKNSSAVARLGRTQDTPPGAAYAPQLRAALMQMRVDAETNEHVEAVSRTAATVPLSARCHEALGLLGLASSLQSSNGPQLTEQADSLREPELWREPG